jgi:hypothetical protein
MGSTAENISTAKRYLRRKYATDLPGLRALAETVAGEALGDSVTLTGQSFEGGSHTGQLVFPRIDYLGAIEQVIAELDTTTPLRPAESSSAYYRFLGPVPGIQS